MKFSCQKVSLLDRLTLVSSVVEGDVPGSVLSSVHMEVTGNELLLDATSPTAAIRTRVEVDGEEDGQVLVPARFFTNLVKVAGSADLKLYLEDTMVVIEGGNSRLTSYSVQDAPTRQSFECDNNIISVPSGSLISMFESAPVAAEHMKDSFNLWSGLRIKNNDVFSVVGCDTRRAMYTFTESRSDTPEYEATIPTRTASLVARLAKRSDFVHLRGDDRRLIFEGEGFTLMSALMNGKYAAVEKVIPSPEQVTTKIRISSSEYYSAVERIKAMTPRRIENPTLYLIANRFGLSFSVQTPEGTLQETMQADVEGETLETVQFAPNYFCEIAPFVVEEPVTLGFCAHRQNALYVNGEGWTYFAMPKGLPTP